MDFNIEEKNKKLNFNTWKKLFQYIKVFKGKLKILAFIMIGVAGIDVIMPLLTKYAIDNFIVKGELKAIRTFAILYIGIIIVQVINIKVFIVFAGRIETGLANYVRKLGF